MVELDYDVLEDLEFQLREYSTILLLVADYKHMSRDIAELVGSISVKLSAISHAVREFKEEVQTY